MVWCQPTSRWFTGSMATLVVTTEQAALFADSRYWEQAAGQLAGSPIELARIERWHLLPGYLDALTGRVRAGLEQFPAENRANVPIIFTAHSLPQHILEWQDPYPDELLETVAAVMERLGPHPHQFAFQSAAISPDPWLGPDAGAAIAALAEAGHKQVLLAHKTAIDRHLEEAGIPVLYTNVFWGGRSEIKPSEISPFSYRRWADENRFS